MTSADIHSDEPCSSIVLHRFLFYLFILSVINDPSKTKNSDLSRKRYITLPIYCTHCVYYGLQPRRGCNDDPAAPPKQDIQADALWLTAGAHLWSRD